MKMKYFTYLNSNDFPTYVIFPGTIDHSMMAHNLRIRTEDLIGAGFIWFPEGKPECFGESVTLKIKMHPEDTSLLERYMDA